MKRSYSQAESGLTKMFVSILMLSEVQTTLGILRDSAVLEALSSQNQNHVIYMRIASSDGNGNETNRHNIRQGPTPSLTF
jgi:hypothetical protein